MFLCLGRGGLGGAGCDLQQVQADDGRGHDVLRVGVGDIHAHDLLAADGEGGGGGRGEEAGGGVQQHVERQARGGADALR